MDLDKLIDELNGDIQFSYDSGEKTDEKSWSNEDGILITRTEARYFVELAERARAELHRKAKSALPLHGAVHQREQLCDSMDIVTHEGQSLPIQNVSQQSELLLQCYKEGFQAAVDALIGANEAVKNKTLQ
jgi:hypothetical protein